MKSKAIIITVLALVFSVVAGAASAQDGAFQGRQDRQPRFRDIGREVFQVVVDATGLTAEDIRSQIQDGATLAQIIETNGGSVNDVVAQVMTVITDRVNEAVANGNRTQEQANDLLEQLQERITDFLNSDRPIRPGGGGRPGNAFGERLQDGIRDEIGRIVTETTGLTGEDIRTQLQDGTTLAEIIEANGGSVEDVIAQVMTAVTERVNEAVENGNLTREQADGLLQGLEERITNAINSEQPIRPLNGRRGGNPQQRQLVRAVAEATGLSAEDVVTQMREGSSLAEVLTANSVDVATFVNEQAAQVETRLNEAVENGRMSREVADARLNLFRVELVDHLNRTPPNRE